MIKPMNLIHKILYTPILAACSHNLRLILRSISFFAQKIYVFLSLCIRIIFGHTITNRHSALKFATKIRLRKLTKSDFFKFSYFRS